MPLLVEQGFDWPAWISAIATLAATVIIALTAKYAVESLRDARRTRNAQLVSDLSRRWDEPAMVESVNLSSEYGTDAIVALVERLYAPKPDEPGEEDDRQREEDLALYARLFIWPNLLEMIGGLHSKDAISTELVLMLWGAEVVAAWEYWRAPIQRIRELEQDWGIYRPFEELAIKMKPLHDARKVKPPDQ